MSAAMADPASEATSATLLKMSLFMMPPNYARAISCEYHSCRTADLLSRRSNTKCRNLRDNIELEQFESSAPGRLGRPECDPALARVSQRSDYLTRSYNFTTAFAPLRPREWRTISLCASLLMYR